MDEVREGPARRPRHGLRLALVRALVALSLLLPFLAGWVWGGTLGAGLQAMFWGGLIRIFLLHHHLVGQLVCHFGLRRFRVRRVAQRLVALLDLLRRVGTTTTTPSSSAFHGLKPELDIGGLVIRVMRRLGLVWKVNVPTAEMQQRRLDALS